MPTSHPARTAQSHELYEIARHNAMGANHAQNNHEELYYDVYDHDVDQYDTDRNTPSTPRSDPASDRSRRTRSGRVIKRNDFPLNVVRGNSARISKSPAPTKKARARERKKIHLLSAPLSELTKDSKIPVRDMEAHIERGVEARLKDLDKSKGKIPRPMNAFILYRSAYAERCKEWCMQNNHQVVSSVSGASWALEPQSLKDHYNELSKVERDRHTEAFPLYKFSPSKPGSARRLDDEDDEEDVFSENDPDADYTPSRRPARQPKNQTSHMAQYTTTAYNQGAYSYAPVNNNFDHWNFENPGRPVPSAYQQMAPYPGQYAQPIVPSHQYYSNMDDGRAMMNVTPTPSYTDQPLVSLPGGQHHELMQSRNHTPAPVYQQPQMGGNYVDHNGMLYPAQVSMPRGETMYSLPSGDSFDDAFGGDFFDVAAGPPSSMQQDWQLDPALAGPFDEYSQYLDQ